MGLEEAKQIAVDSEQWRWPSSPLYLSKPTVSITSTEIKKGRYAICAASQWQIHNDTPVVTELLSQNVNAHSKHAIQSSAIIGTLLEIASLQW